MLDELQFRQLDLRILSCQNADNREHFSCSWKIVSRPIQHLVIQLVSHLATEGKDAAGRLNLRNSIIH
jgi:hypothetical protein